METLIVAGRDHKLPRQRRQAEASIADAATATRITRSRTGTAVLSERALLVTLALGNFVLGTGAFVLPALLQPLAGDLAISLPAAGWLMSGYALAYAVSSPLLTAVTGRWPRRRVC